jgi:hypothetical protein
MSTLACTADTRAANGRGTTAGRIHQDARSSGDCNIEHARVIFHRVGDADAAVTLMFNFEF